MEGSAALLEMLFSFGVIMAIGFWQLRSVRREIRRDRELSDERKRHDDSAG